MSQPTLEEDDGPLIHALCRQEFATIEAFNRHVGISGPPDFVPQVAECPVMAQRYELIASGRYAEDPTSGALRPATRAERKALKRNTPGRKRQHASNAAKQRAYRDRKR